MKVLQVTTLLSDDGTSGGVSTVAVAQCKALASLGLDVTLLGGTLRGRPIDLASGHGLRVRASAIHPAFRGSGLRALIGLRIIWLLLAEVRRADVVHVHLCRDVVTCWAVALCRFSRTPLVIQPHGMLQPRPGLAFRVWDVVLRRIVPTTAYALCLAPTEPAQLAEVFRRVVPTKRIVNPVAPVEQERAARPSASSKTLIFVGRLHPRKRPLILVDLAEALKARGFEATIVIIGPDEGEGSSLAAAIRAKGLAQNVILMGPVHHREVLRQVATASLLLLPSLDEPFPMACLEALAADVPVAITESCGIADRIRKSGAGLVTADEPAKFVDGVVRFLASGAAIEAARAACRPAIAEFAPSAVAAELVGAYVQAMP